MPDADHCIARLPRQTHGKERLLVLGFLPLLEIVRNTSRDIDHWIGPNIPPHCSSYIDLPAGVVSSARTYYRRIQCFAALKAFVMAKQY